jgi:shikimate dehydrogenase
MTRKVSRAALTGVFGCPVDENPTGIMQEAAFAAKGLDWRYLTLLVRPADLPAAMAGLRAMNFQGINLTIPHKVEVMQYLDEVAPDAAMIGAVNTVRRDGERLIGENTDGKGFLMSLCQDARVDPDGKRVVFLGAGGAAKAMATELALAGAGHITIVNRTAERGEALVQALRERAKASVAFTPWQGAYRIPADTDIFVNATSIGLFPDTSMPEVDLSTVHPGLLVCDVIPNPPQTPFLKAVQACGARTLDGLGMLVYQGAIGFKLWTGEDAPVAVMRQALCEVFGA